MRETLQAIRDQFKVDYRDDGEISGVAYGSKALPQVVRLLDAALAASQPAPAADTGQAMDGPERLWLSDADSDNYHDVWFEPDEGGTPYIRADLARAAPALVCAGCGSHWSDEVLAAEKATNPALISCCPERRMVTPLEAAIREWGEGPSDDIEELIAAAKKAVGE